MGENITSDNFYVFSSVQRLP